MDDMAKLIVRTREERGSRAARRMRRAGEIPANLSGQGLPPLALAVPGHEFEMLRQAGAQLVTLSLDGEDSEAIVREVQFDALGEHMLHVDLDRVVSGQKLEVEIPLVFFGDSVLNREGTVFQVHHNRVNVECLPRKIPDEIEVDVRGMEIGDEIRLSDIPFPEDVEPAGYEEDELIAHLAEAETEVSEEEEIEEVLAEGVAEPEVVGEKSEEDTEEEEED